MKKQKPRNIVILLAEESEGKIVESHEVSYDAYYDGEIDLIDSNAYRAGKGIYCIKGEIYDSAGALQQAFENRYSIDGRILRTRAVFADGTVVDEELNTG